MIFGICFTFVFAGNKFKFRWEVILYFSNLVKMEFLQISNLKEVDLRDWELHVLLV